jgi:hypothetical protein
MTGDMIGAYLQWGVVPSATTWDIVKYGVVDINVGSVPQDTNWHMVAVVYSSMGSFIYVDGIVNGSSANNSNFVSQSNAQIEIGCAKYCNRFSGGLIDDVRIYNRALSATEIQALYNAEK